MFDTHAHLTGLEEKRDVTALLERASAANVVAIINICTHPEELAKGIKLAQKTQRPKIFNAAALTPHDAASATAEEHLEFFAQSASKGELVAIGECGLDYHYDIAKERQWAVFERQMKIAEKLKLPLLIHCREAFEDLFKMLSGRDLSAVLIHCFTGTADEAKQAIECGYFLGISGIATFKKSLILKEIVKTAPLNQLVLETDAPYLAPEGYRGKPNESAYIHVVAEEIARLKDLSLSEIYETTTSSAIKLFSIKSNQFLL